MNARELEQVTRAQNPRLPCQTLLPSLCARVRAQYCTDNQIDGTKIAVICTQGVARENQHYLALVPNSQKFTRLIPKFVRDLFAVHTEPTDHIEKFLSWRANQVNTTLRLERGKPLPWNNLKELRHTARAGAQVHPYTRGSDKRASTTGEPNSSFESGVLLLPAPCTILCILSS